MGKENNIGASLDWRVRPFEQLTVSELYEILSLRSRVFVLEQECIYHDMDNEDQCAIHITACSRACQGSGDVLQAYARILAPKTRYSEPSIGRVVINTDQRGMGIGLELMERSIIAVEQYYPGEAIAISAQQHLHEFYSRMKFEPVGKPYLEDDIPHIKMVRAIS